MIAAAGYRRLAAGESDGLNFMAKATMKIDNFALEGYDAPRSARYKT
jgi:hypothetical protein